MNTDIKQFHKSRSNYFKSSKFKVSVAIWILAGLTAIWNFWPSSIGSGNDVFANGRTKVSEKDRGFTIPIDKIQIGMRVHAHNPQLTDLERENITEPNWSTFSALDVEMTKTDAGIVEITLLRSPEWMEQHKPVVGGTVPVASAEFNAMGESKVVAIRDAPKIDKGPGHVVTATFKHMSSEVLDLYVDGNDMPLGTTPNHPIWSVDRQRFVKAGNLRQGETLRTMFNQQLQLRFINKRKSLEPVYNVTVYGQHTYFVGDDALLVHNNDSYGEHVKKARMPVRIKSLEYLGEGPEASAVRVKSRYQAGASRGNAFEEHHVFPQQYEKMFAKRGIDIHDYAIDLDFDTHKSIHGGSDWRLAKKRWEGEWNSQILKDLKQVTRAKGSRLTPEEIISVGENRMRLYGLIGEFHRYSRAPKKP